MFNKCEKLSRIVPLGHRDDNRLVMTWCSHIPQGLHDKFVSVSETIDYINEAEYILLCHGTVSNVETHIRRLLGPTATEEHDGDDFLGMLKGVGEEEGESWGTGAPSGTEKFV